MTPTPQAIENAARAGEPCPGLRPCPFCGEKKIYFNPPAPEIDFLGSLNCPACLASMPNETNNVEELIGCWNHREPTDLGDMALVPKEPTEAMLEAAVVAGHQANKPFVERIKSRSFEAGMSSDITAGDGRIYRAAYRAMIAAAEDLNWSPPFKAGDRVMHAGRSENGTVTAIEDGCVVVEFDSPTPRGNKSIGRYDETWFRQYPRGLIAAAEDSNDQG